MASCSCRPRALTRSTAGFSTWFCLSEHFVDVSEKPFNEKNLFATIFKALGIDPYATYDLPELPTFHRVEDKAEPIHEVLA